MSAQHQLALFAFHAVDTTVPLSSGARKLFYSIRGLARATGVCFAKQVWFANLFKVSRQTVVGWIQELLSRGIVSMRRRYHTSSEYTVLRSPSRAETRHSNPTLTRPLYRKTPSESDPTGEEHNRFDSPGVQKPVQNAENRVVPDPPRKPNRTEPVATPEETAIVHKHLYQFQRWIDRPLNADPTVVRLTIAAGRERGATIGQIAAELAAIYRRVAKAPRLKPEHWGFFPKSISFKFRQVDRQGSPSETRKITCYVSPVTVTPRKNNSMADYLSREEAKLVDGNALRSLLPGSVTITKSIASPPVESQINQSLEAEYQRICPAESSSPPHIAHMDSHMGSQEIPAESWPDQLRRKNPGYEPVFDGIVWKLIRKPAA